MYFGQYFFLFTHEADSYPVEKYFLRPFPWVSARINLTQSPFITHINSDWVGTSLPTLLNVFVCPRTSWNLEGLMFEGEGKPVYPEKTFLVQGREPTANSFHKWRRRKFSHRKRALPFLRLLRNVWPVTESVAVIKIRKKNATQGLIQTYRILISLPYHYTTIPTTKIPKKKLANSLSWLFTSITGDPSPFHNFYNV